MSAAGAHRFRTEAALPRHGVLLAGGLGTRLGALTRHVPKPLLPVQGVPVIERLVAALRDAGVETCTVVTCHHAEAIEARLGDGSRLGVQIVFLREREPLGTAGCLGLLQPPAGPFFLANADIVTDLCFQSLAERHVLSGAAATVAVCRHAIPIEYGVVDCDAVGRVTAYREKPVHESHVSMGIYCLAPQVCRHVAVGEVVSMPQVLARLLAADEAVVCHRHDGVWADIGTPDEYARCQQLALPGIARWSGRAAA